MAWQTTQLFVSAILTIISRRASLSYSFCDVAPITDLEEGNLGQAGTFSWLGVLRIVLYDRDQRHPAVALSGVVLFKRQYVLIDAHDVSRVPLPMLRDNGRVMFFGNTDEPYYLKPKKYTAHPEYGAITHSTVAILELDLSKIKDYPLTPVCWLKEALNASTFLYAVGYTDENKLLEKMVYHMQYLDKEGCSDFYDRAKLGDKTLAPVYPICGHAASYKTQCVFDNGMALVTNVSGYFSLLGFGIHGPGCAAPARFINLQPYYEWMDEVTSDRDDYEYDEARRSGGFHEVPLHDLFQNKSILRESSGVPTSIHMPPSLYPADVESPRYFNIDETEKGAISVFPSNNSQTTKRNLVVDSRPDDDSLFDPCFQIFNGTYENYDNACSSWRTLMYREHFELNAKGGTGSATYKVSLYDLLIARCTCIKIVMDTESHSSAILSIKEQIDLTEGEALTSSEEMFDNLMMHYPINELYTPEPAVTTKWEPKVHHKPIKDKAIMKIEMYGEPFEPSEPTTTTTKEELLRMPAKEKRVTVKKHKPTNKPKLQAQRTYKKRLPNTKLVKSGFVKPFIGINNLTFSGKRKPNNKAKTATIKKTITLKDLGLLNSVLTGPISVKDSRDSSKVYNFTRLLPVKHPARIRPVLPSNFKSNNVSTTRRRSSKYDKVHLFTQAFHTSTLYPIASVESVNGAAGFPRNVDMLKITFIKVLCFDLVMLVLYF